MNLSQNYKKYFGNSGFGRKKSLFDRLNHQPGKVVKPEILKNTSRMTIPVAMTQVEKIKEIDPWLQKHVQNESQVLEDLISKGRFVKTIQSATKGRVYYETVVFTGYTAVPDLKTYVRTYEDGRLESFSKKLMD